MWGGITDKCKILWKVWGTGTGSTKAVTSEKRTEVRTGSKYAKVRTSSKYAKVRTGSKYAEDGTGSKYTQSWTEQDTIKAGKETGVNQFYAKTIKS